MIITITGKPCSGKGTVSKLFCQKYNFKYVCTGDMFREFAKQFGYNSVLEFQQNYNKIEEIDNLIDSKTAEIGKTQANENIVIDSRLAWNFVPNSFKVFIDVDFEVAGERLLGANRQNEKATSIENAVETLKNRWQEENDRYNRIYNINNLNFNNYDYVISSNNLKPEQVATKIHEEYIKFMQKA
jgi:cytidylate kinase